MKKFAAIMKPVRALAVLACVLVAACGTTLPSSAGQGRPVVGDDPCPSKDFTRFLQRYAGAEDDSVRSRFTLDPLEYEVPTHTLEDETASSPATLVLMKAGPSRLDLFPYRYFEKEQVFDRIAGSPAHPGKVPYPVAVDEVREDRREVVFGMEYEVDTYRFERRSDCWYMTRARNLRD
ncbi:MAG: hypothetical protein M3Q40_10265 [Pseudomonadota bacterium]|nr:hypothetical protein [Pseudomonadota bacterium]